MEHQAGNFSFDDFLIVIVLYRATLEQSTSFVSLSQTEGRIEHIDLLVYDNSPEVQGCPDVFERNGFKVHYISDPVNPGIGKAYNTGVEMARKKNKKWILFLDQDTKIAKQTLSLFLEKINREKGIKIFATTLFADDGRLISPSLYLFKRGFRLSNVPEGRRSLKRIRPINSLLLLSLGVFDTVGGYNEKIRLDFSDHEFMGRVQRKHPQMFVVRADNRHSLSSTDDVDFEGIKNRFTVFCHGAHVAGSDNMVVSLQYLLVCFLRALRLGIRFKTFFFIETLTKEWRSNP